VYKTTIKQLFRVIKAIIVITGSKYIIFDQPLLETKRQGNRKIVAEPE